MSRTWPPFLRVLLASAALALASCRCADSGGAAVLTPDEVRAMASSIARDLESNGPKAWLHYFVQGPEFFMAANGALQFSSFAEAETFLASYSAGVSHLTLAWGPIRVDPVGPGMAVMGAPYEEVITDTAGKANRYQGYFTAAVVRTASGPKLRDAHWSSPIGTP
jgi:hypothetical protein